MIIQTALGKYQGIKEKDYYVFKGIPFAKAPIKKRRFKAPVPISKHDHVIDATQWKTKAWQNHGTDDVVKCSEDCLYLNIWTKNPNTKNKPVVVWVHGGGFTSGSGADEFFNGSTFADETVFVTVNYRLGVFGFLDVSPVLGADYVGSGNNGMLDIVEALRFISNHIEHFGGNKDLITVMGESAGAKCVSTLLTIEPARKLIHQVILQSGSVQCIRDMDTAQYVTSEFLKHVPHNDLLALSPAQLLEAQNQISTVSMGQLHLFGPVLDGVVIQDEPFVMLERLKDYPIKALMGFNKDEAALFLDNNPPLQHREADCLSALFGTNTNYILNQFAQGTRSWEKTLTLYLYQNASMQLAHELVAHGHPVYFYRLDWGQALGACHAQDLALVFNIIMPGDQLHDLPAEALDLSAVLHGAWKQFMTGHAPQVNWPLLNDKWEFRVINHDMSVSTLSKHEIDWNFPIQVFKK